MNVTIKTLMTLVESKLKSNINVVGVEENGKVPDKILEVGVKKGIDRAKFLNETILPLIKKTYASARYLPGKVNGKTLVVAGGKGKSSAGAIEINESRKKGVEIYILVKDAVSKFRPGAIPGLCGTWHSATTMLMKTRQYASTKLPEDVRVNYLKILDEVGKSKTATKNGAIDGKVEYTFEMSSFEASPEFFELILAIQVARLMEVDDTNIKSILRMPKRAINKAAVRIFIPSNETEKLVDFFITDSKTLPKAPTITGSNAPGIYWISVKASIGKPHVSTNTIKFNQAFDTPAEAKKYYTEQGTIQSAIAYAGASQPQSGSLLYPIAAAGMISRKTDWKQLVIAAGGTKSGIVNISALADAIEVCRKTLTRPDGTIQPFVIQNRNTADFGQSVHQLLDKKQIAALENVINDHLIKDSKEKFSPKYTFQQLTTVLERLLTQASKTSNLNFYNVFYDTVISTKRVCYGFAAIVPIAGSKGKWKLTLKYIGVVNLNTAFPQVTLRGKNSMVDWNSGTMGMNL